MIALVLAVLAQADVTDVTWIERGGILAVFAVIIYAFYTGKVTSEKVVPREQYDRAMAVNATYANEVIPNLTTGLTDAITMLRVERQKNGDGP